MLAKRGFDLAVALALLLVLVLPLLVLWMIASWDTRANGLFVQVRIGRFGRPFKLLKLRTMRSVAGVTTCVTTASDPRVTRLGAWLRRWKLDELPQLWNVLVGEMSLVGPRPDVPGFADCLEGCARRILLFRPGITGPASLAFRDEEALLAAQPDPEWFNREVVFPEKVRLNLAYVDHWCFSDDLYYLFLTLTGQAMPLENAA